MGSALNSIIATAFQKANAGPGPGESFIGAQRDAKLTDGLVRVRNANADLLEQGLADELAVRDAIAGIQGLPAEQAALEQQFLSDYGQAVPVQAPTGPVEPTADGMKYWGADPGLAQRAIDRFGDGQVELSERQQQLMSLLVQRDPNFRAAFVNQMLPQEYSPQSPVGKLQADRAAAAQAGAGPDVLAQYDAAIAKAGRDSNPVVNVTNEPPVQQKEEDKRFGALLVDDFDRIQQAADAATENLQQLHIQRTLKPDTGSLEGIKATGGALAQALGVELDDEALAQIEGVQSFNAITGNILAAKLASQKGPQTDEDARRMKETLASIDNVEGANDFILRSSIATETRKVEMVEFAREWKRTTGTLDGWRRAWAEFKKKTPLLGVNPNTGRAVFYTEFMDEAGKANPGASREQLLQAWRDKYG